MGVQCDSNRDDLGLLFIENGLLLFLIMLKGFFKSEELVKVPLLKSGFPTKGRVAFRPFPPSRREDFFKKGLEKGDVLAELLILLREKFKAL